MLYPDVFCVVLGVLIRILFYIQLWTNLPDFLRILISSGRLDSGLPTLFNKNILELV